MEDQSLSHNELLEKVLREVNQYYLHRDIVPTILEYSPIDLGIVKNQLSLIREWVKIQKDPGIKKLQEIEKEYYKPIIHKLIDQEDSTSLDNLHQLFEDLASLSVSIGDYAKDSQDSDASALKYYSDAAIFYQYQYSIKQKIDPIKLEIDYTNLDSLKQKILTFINGTGAETTQDIEIEAKQNIATKIGEEIEKNKEKLLAIRSTTKEDLIEIDKLADENDNKNYIEKSKDLFGWIALNMKGFLKDLCKEAEKEIGLEPPCDYALMGLGSMALNQMTPYSDIEFAILTENDNYKDCKEDAKTRVYFRNLSHLIHFKVINLGETIIPTSRYELDMSHIVHPGVNFDLGGKTPLGRIGGDKPYDLIQTVEGMMWYVENEDNKSEHIDKNLPFILEKVTYITGNEKAGNKKLVVDYQELVSNFLEADDSSVNTKLSNLQVRALKTLKEGSVEIDYIHHDIQKKKHQGDLEKYQHDIYLSSKLCFKPFNVKQEIYRPIDILIPALSAFFKINALSVWDAISSLEGEGFIGSGNEFIPGKGLEAKDNLLFAASFSNILRLKAYTHYGKQQDILSVFSKEISLDNNEFQLSEGQIKEDSALFRFFYTLFSFYESMNFFFDIINEDTSLIREDFIEKLSVNHQFAREVPVFAFNSFYDASEYSKAAVFYRLGKYKEALENLRLQYKDQSESMPLLENLIKLLRICNNPEEEKYREIYKAKRLSQAPESTDLYESEIGQILSKFDLGNIVLGQKDFSEALKYYVKVEEIINKSQDKGFEFFLYPLYSNMIECYISINDLDSAEKTLDTAMQLPDASTHKSFLIRSIDLHLKLGRYEDMKLDAQKYIEQFNSIDQDRIEVLLDLCAAQMSLQENPTETLEEMLNILPTLLSHDFSSSKSLGNRALLCARNILSESSNLGLNKTQIEFIVSKVNGIYENFFDNIAVPISLIVSYSSNYSNLEKYCKKFADQNTLDTDKVIKLAGIFLPGTELSGRFFAKFKSQLLANYYFEKNNLKMEMDETILKVAKMFIHPVDEVDSQNMTKMHMAASIGNIKAVELLIEYGADVNKSDDVEGDRLSPLHYVFEGFENQPIKLQILELLLENGANPNQQMDDGNTPIHMAHNEANLDAIELLLKYKADINVKNAEGKTPLHCLLEEQDIDNDKKLDIINKFQNYYNVLLEDNNNRTADDYVQEYCIEASEDLTLALASTSLLALNHSGDVDITGNLIDSGV